VGHHQVVKFRPEKLYHVAWEHYWVFWGEGVPWSRIHKKGFILVLSLYNIRYYFICYLNPLTPNDHYSGRTAPLTSKRCILYIYSTNTGTEYFKHGIYSPFFSLQNAVCFIILTYLVPVLFTFYIQCVLKF